MMLYFWSLSDYFFRMQHNINTKQLDYRWDFASAIPHCFIRYVLLSDLLKYVCLLIWLSVHELDNVDFEKSHIQVLSMAEESIQNNSIY